MGSSLSAKTIANEYEAQHGPKSLNGKVVIITGANSGIGFGMFQALAPLSPKIFVGKHHLTRKCSSNDILRSAGRNETKCTEAIEKIKQESQNDDIHFLKVDFEDFDSVKESVKSFKQQNLPIHFLFNNAGFFGSQYEETKNGNDRMLRELLVDIVF
jgi:NAD(P)-dependent dehydrogenase (short-subunit alcohol dehydrogenase family)